MVDEEAATPIEMKKCVDEVQAKINAEVAARIFGTAR